MFFCGVTLDLFESITGAPRNLLPNDGTVNYYGPLFSLSECEYYMQNLFNKVEWKNDEVIVLGKRVVTKRKIAWYGDKPYEYTYSCTTKHALPWVDELIALRKIIEKRSNETYNSCLLNLYHNGDEGMTWHSDGEKDLKPNSAIASLSFGAERNFSFKHKKNKEKISLVLQKGSLLVMKDETQKSWLHCLPKTKKQISPRINLTFRTISE